MPALLDTVDPDGLEEFSVVFTDRSLNHMSAVFQRVMTDISDMLKDVYYADAVAVIDIVDERVEDLSGVGRPGGRQHDLAQEFVDRGRWGRNDRGSTGENLEDATREHRRRRRQ